jgi:hypothetical protein
LQLAWTPEYRCPALFRNVDRVRAANVVATAVLLAAGDAHGDDDRNAMFGIAVFGAEAARPAAQVADLAGGTFDIAWWHGRLGLAGEASATWQVQGGAARALVLGGSVRLRVLERMVPSLMEPRDVELGIELQGIVERAWWDTGVGVDPVTRGVGVALRLRGDADPPGSNVIAESRLFVRVLSSRWSEPAAVPRVSSPVAHDGAPALTILIGIGASFGSCSPGYMDRFRMHPFSSSVL